MFWFCTTDFVKTFALQMATSARRPGGSANSEARSMGNSMRKQVQFAYHCSVDWMSRTHHVQFSFSSSHCSAVWSNSS